MLMYKPGMLAAKSRILCSCQTKKKLPVMPDITFEVPTHSVFDTGSPIFRCNTLPTVSTSRLLPVIVVVRISIPERFTSTSTSTVDSIKRRAKNIAPRAFMMTSVRLADYKRNKPSQLTA